MQLPGLGRRSIQAISSSLQQPISSDAELAQQLGRIRESDPRITAPTVSEIQKAAAQATKLMAQAEELGIAVIGMESSDYPGRLRSIADPPVLLFAKGNIAALSEAKIVALIGTREPSPWGAAAGERLAERFAEHGVCVVSGLAHGCDAAAHLGCLRANGTTIAVLAHGLDMTYPAANRQLSEQIIEKNGCIVSEYPTEVRAQRSFFIERDRIQSGLSDAVVVIETDMEGGTMHTVKACLSQKRILACLAHPARYANAKSRGNEMLIHRGDAIEIRGSDDVLALIDRLGSMGCPERPQNPKPESSTLFG